MRQIWKRIEPDSYEGAVVERAELENESQELLKSAQDTNNLNSDVDDFFESENQETKDDFDSII